MVKSGILVVADNAALRATLARWLLQAGYALELAENPRRAQEVGSKAGMLSLFRPGVQPFMRSVLALDPGRALPVRSFPAATIFRSAHKMLLCWLLPGPTPSGSTWQT
jgi:CheY-like chemotaxis protein